MAEDIPDIAFFTSIPWCARLLGSAAYQPMPTLSRQPKASTEDTLFAETLNTPATISACLSVYKKPTPTTTSSSSINSSHRIEKVLTFLHLSQGMNGYPRVLHGGLVSALLDESMALLLSVNKRSAHSDVRRDAVTKELTVSFERKVSTPATVVVGSWFEEVRGGARVVRAEMRDAEGEVLARGRGLWVVPREAKV